MSKANETVEAVQSYLKKNPGTSINAALKALNINSGRYYLARQSLGISKWKQKPKAKPTGKTVIAAEAPTGGKLAVVFGDKQAIAQLLGLMP